MATQQLSEVVTKEQAEAFWESGYLRVPSVFSADEADDLADDLDLLISRWAFDTEWTGPWRQVLLDPELARTSRFRALHDLQRYSAAWSRAISNERLVAVLTALLGEDIEFHHTTMHVKPPESGQPFPMHQDWPFYPHADERYVDVLVHLDDTQHENGEIRFLPGSHKGGPLQHTTVADRTACTPHLSQHEYRLADTVAVPAQRGDIVCFNINTVHGSYLNSTLSPRRLVRMGYRHAGNAQLSGQSFGRPGIMVAGSRPRGVNQEPFSESI
jgi:phytanoyl-CoA hydroxylase